MRSTSWAALGLATLLLSACLPDDKSELPLPRELSREESGYYCGMIVADHPGPKGQVFVGDVAEPLWFPSVRDTIAFLMLPGEQKNLRAVFVTDMARATSWDSPGPGAWVVADDAWYVLGSRKRGGMGLAEAVPFGNEAAAQAFVTEHGGRVARLSDIPPSYVFDMTRLEHDGADDG